MATHAATLSPWVAVAMSQGRSIVGAGHDAEDPDRARSRLAHDCTDIERGSIAIRLDSGRIARESARADGARPNHVHRQLRDIESLYQVANKDLRAPSSRETLLKVVAMYPHANRAGCALLYLAQMSPPDEREAYLKRAIEEHADAWYGDGTQVGPFAKAQLAALYAVTNRSAEAALLAEEVERSFPEAVDHSGNRLTNTLRKLKLL